MKTAILLFSICSIFNVAMMKHLGKNKDGLDIFTIDLDLPPKQRFQEVTRHMMNETRTLADLYL